MSSPNHNTVVTTSSAAFDCAFCEGRVHFVSDETTGALGIIHNLPACRMYRELDPGNSDHFVKFARAIRRAEEAKIMKRAGVTCERGCAYCADEECVPCGTIKADHLELCDGCDVLTRHGLGKS